MKSMSHTSSPSSTNRSPHQLTTWLHQTLRYQGTQMRCQTRGNILHLLYEGDPCPDQELVTYHVLSQLNKTDINRRSHGVAPIYQVLLYGRLLRQQKPSWTFRINLDQLGHYLHHFTVRGYSDQAARQSTGNHHTAQTHTDNQTTHSVSSAHPTKVANSNASSPSNQTAVDVTNRSLESQASLSVLDEESAFIARQLSDTLSQLGVSVKVEAKTLARPVPSAIASSVRFPSVDPTSDSKRLFVRCRAAYSPSPSLIAEPIARKLRSLNLNEVQDAVLSICVNGEEKPDWTLRIDLTPANTLLREWARWGDIEALSHLLTHSLKSIQVEITTASYQETTLHLACQPCTDDSSSSNFSASAVTAIVHPLLETLSPQGVQASVIYGQHPNEDAPQWVEYLTLSDADDAQVALSPLTLAQNGNLEAIAYLVSRLLNPDLNTHLATGGIRVQLLQRDNLLHVMCDAPICPDQTVVTNAVIRLLDQIREADIAGVRIYGRQAGTRSPNWNHGTDFVDRARTEPQTPAEFVTSDASYVNDLLEASEDSPLREDLTTAELWARWSRLRQQLTQQARRSLLKTQLVTYSSESSALALPSSVRTHGLKTAAVWAAVGILSVVQVDWLMSRVHYDTPQAEANSELTVTASPTSDTNDLVLDENNVDGPNTAPDIASAQAEVSGSSVLSLVSGSSADALSAIQAKLLEQSPYPTFNSDQLDLKLALYYQHVAEFGPPDVLVIGSSRALRGIDPLILENALTDLGYDNADVFNFGINGATAKVVELVIQRILVPEQLPKLVLWADGARAFNGGREDRTYNGIAESEGYQLLSQGGLDIPVVNSDDQPTEQQSSSVQEDWFNAVSRSIRSSYEDLDDWLSAQLGRISMAHQNRDEVKAFLQDSLTGNAELQAFVSSTQDEAIASVDEQVNERTETTASVDTQDTRSPANSARAVGKIDSDGFLPLDTRFDPVTYYDEYERVPGNYDRDYANFQLFGQQADALQSLLQLGNAQDVPIVFVNLPLTDEYLDPYRTLYEQEFRQHLLTVDLAHDAFIFRDLSELWLEDEDSTYHRYFSDPSHLNQYGALEVTKRIAQDPMIPWTSTDF